MAAVQPLLTVSAIYVACSQLLMLLLFLVIASVTFVMATHVYKRAHLSWRMMTCRNSSAGCNQAPAAPKYNPDNVRWLSLSDAKRMLDPGIRAKLRSKVEDIKNIMRPATHRTDPLEAQCSTVAETPANREISELYANVIPEICSSTCANAFKSVGGSYTGNYDVASQLCWCKLNDCDDAMAAPCDTRTRIKVYANGLSIASRQTEAELCPSVCMMSNRGRRARAVLTFGNEDKKDAPRTFTHCTCDVDAC